MSIAFSADRWSKVQHDAARWWSGESKRPLIQMAMRGRDPDRPEPKLRPEPKTAYYDFDIPASDIVDRWDYDLSRVKFLGDAFPATWPNFGPGVMAAFLGGGTELGYETVWFTPNGNPSIPGLAFEYRSDTSWQQRVTDIMKAGTERWQGLVQIGTTDLGGAVDILSTFRPSEGLLLDLYDHPDHVKRCVWELHELWFQYFDALNNVMQPTNPGYTAWTAIYSETPYYMLQCDFCYMIGPDMFDEFVLPELAAACRRLDNPFYHLDGPNCLPHLDSLLSIDELKGIQWVPGSGQPDFTHWPHVYRKIRDAGKRIQFVGNIDTFETIARQLGSTEGIVFMGSADIGDEAEVLDFLSKYDVI